MDYKQPVLKDTKIIQLIVNDRYRLLRHAVLLISILVIIFYSDWLSPFSGSYKYFRLLCVYTILISMLYINMYVLVPGFFFKSKYILYLSLLFLLMFAGLMTMSWLLNSYLNPVRVDTIAYKSQGTGTRYEGIITLIAILLVTTMIKLFQRWTLDNERIAELKDITLKMELNELRSQINPHFLFNMLNGIKALVRSNPEKATSVIMKLSEFLRYQLYENTEEKTLLRSEINFLSNFLNLEMIRRDNLLINISSPTEPGILNGIFLPPNLFTIFIENAVKHSVNISGAESFIKVTIEVIEEKLYFSCVNSKDADYVASDKKNSGLGLANIKRRLKLLYDNNYSLDIVSSDQQYNVNLVIPL